MFLLTNTLLFLFFASNISILGLTLLTYLYGITFYHRGMLLALFPYFVNQLVWYFQGYFRGWRYEMFFAHKHLFSILMAKNSKINGKNKFWQNCPSYRNLENYIFVLYCFNKTYEMLFSIWKYLKSWSGQCPL